MQYLALIDIGTIILIVVAILGLMLFGIILSFFSVWLRAWLAGLPGLVKTAAREWPKAALRSIDVERGGRPCEAVAAAA